MSKKFKPIWRGYGVSREIDCGYWGSIIEIVVLVEQICPTNMEHPFRRARKKLAVRTRRQPRHHRARHHLAVITVPRVSRDPKRVYSKRVGPKTHFQHCLRAVWSGTSPTPRTAPPTMTLVRWHHHNNQERYPIKPRASPRFRHLLSRVSVRSMNRMRIPFLDACDPTCRCRRKIRRDVACCERLRSNLRCKDDQPK